MMMVSGKLPSTPNALLISIANADYQGPASLQKYNVEKCFCLCKHFRNNGLLQNIMDHIRLTWLKHKFLEAQPDCSFNNWRELCGTPVSNNHQTTYLESGISLHGAKRFHRRVVGFVKPTNYQFADEVICVAEGA